MTAKGCTGMEASKGLSPAAVLQTTGVEAEIAKRGPSRT